MSMSQNMEAYSTVHFSKFFGNLLEATSSKVVTAEPSVFTMRTFVYNPNAGGDTGMITFHKYHRLRLGQNMKLLRHGYCWNHC